MNPGTDVFSPWLNDPCLYPAVLVALEGPIAFVAYYDGEAAKVPAAGLRPLNVQPGVQVQINWKNKGQYWPAVVKARVGAAIQVEYASDGSMEWTTIAKCRVQG